MINLRMVKRTSTLLKHFYQLTLANEGWRPCINDVDCLLEHEQASIYVVESQKKPVATISAVKYGSNVMHFGSFIIHKEYRKLGYVKSIMQVMREHHDEEPGSTIKVWYAAASQVEFLKKINGAVCQWPVGIYDLNVRRSLDKLQGYSSHFQLNHIDVNNMHDVLVYDNKVFGYTREKLLRMWLGSPGTHARVAFNKDGRVLGYVVVRLAFFTEEGYKLGPLYCKDIEVGKSLIKSVFEDINDHGFSRSNSVIVDSPTGRNAKAKELMEFLDGRYLGDIYYLTTNGLPNASFDQWFAIFSPAYG